MSEHKYRLAINLNNNVKRVFITREVLKIVLKPHKHCGRISSCSLKLSRRIKSVSFDGMNLDIQYRHFHGSWSNVMDRANISYMAQRVSKESNLWPLIFNSHCFYYRVAKLTLQLTSQTILDPFIRLQQYCRTYFKNTLINFSETKLCGVNI